MYHQVKTSPVICDNNANFCQGAPGDSVKTQSRSGLSILFTTMPGLTPSAYWCFDFSGIFFFLFSAPEKSHRLVESKTVKGMFATRLRNTCPPSLPIAHQTHTGLQMDASPTRFRTPKQHWPQPPPQPPFCFSRTCSTAAYGGTLTIILPLYSLNFFTAENVAPQCSPPPPPPPPPSFPHVLA